MRKLAMLAVAMILVAIPGVMARATGGLRISPAWPVMVESPADFTVWAQSADSYDVNVLLVTTEECYNEFADAPHVVATVDYPAGPYTIGFTKNAFNAATDNSEKVPPNAEAGAGYTVASLKDHLDYGLSTPLGSEDTIYWAIAPLNDPDFDPLTTTPVNITVSEEGCSNPRMLVYLLGHSEDGAELFDMKVPPTIPGFVVPEVAPIFVAGASLAGLALYGIRQKRK